MEVISRKLLPSQNPGHIPWDSRPPLGGTTKMIPCSEYPHTLRLPVCKLRPKSSSTASEGARRCLCQSDTGIHPLFRMRGSNSAATGHWLQHKVPPISIEWPESQITKQLDWIIQATGSFISTSAPDLQPKGTQDMTPYLTCHAHPTYYRICRNSRLHVLYNLHIFLSMTSSIEISSWFCPWYFFVDW